MYPKDKFDQSIAFISVKVLASIIIDRIVYSHKNTIFGDIRIKNYSLSLAFNERKYFISFIKPATVGYVFSRMGCK
jgi:hypothetical protein